MELLSYLFQSSSAASTSQQPAAVAPAAAAPILYPPSYAGSVTFQSDTQLARLQELLQLMWLDLQHLRQVFLPSHRSLRLNQSCDGQLWVQIAAEILVR